MDIQIPFKRHIYQEEIAQRMLRFNILVCHRRFGKTILAANEGIRILLEAYARYQREDIRRSPKIAYIAPFYSQAKDVAWDFFTQSVRPFKEAGLCKIKESDPVSITFPEFKNAKIHLFGTDNAGRMRGMGFDFVILDEPAMMREGVWTSIIRPTLSDRHGGALFIGTPEGRNYFCDLYESAIEDPSWYAGMYKLSDTIDFYRNYRHSDLSYEEVQRLKAEMPHDEYLQEYECSFDAAIKGTYWSSLLNVIEDKGQVGEIAYEPSLPVHTAWDIGVNDSTSIWFFQEKYGGWIDLIDYYECNGEGIRFYAQLLRDKAYFYGNHWAPHDAMKTEFGTGKTIVETAREYSINFKVVPKLSIRDGIQAVRGVIPKCRFNKKTTEVGYKYLRMYRKDYNKRMRVFKNKPLHDEASNAADAFRYMAIAVRKEGRQESMLKMGPADMSKIGRGVTPPNKYINSPDFRQGPANYKNNTLEGRYNNGR